MVQFQTLQWYLQLGRRLSVGQMWISPVRTGPGGDGLPTYLETSITGLFETEPQAVVFCESQISKLRGVSRTLCSTDLLIQDLQNLRRFQHTRSPAALCYINPVVSAGPVSFIRYTTIMSSFMALDLPPIDEGSCLLRSYALQRTRVRDSDVLVFHYIFLYPGDDEEEEQFERDPSTMLRLSGVQQLYTLVSDKLQINPHYLHNESLSTLVMYFSALSLLIAKQ